MNEVGEKWGKYQIERLIATGGMAEIFEANLLGPGGFVKRVCLKRVRPELSNNPQFVEMFESEARIAARLEHPNIVSVTDFDRHDGQLFLAMELVDGVDLRQILGTASAMGLRLPPEFAVHVMERLLDALSHAHTLEVDGVPRPVIHRDVSPHNILISADGAVKLTDFGIAKAKGVTNEATAQGTIKGKFAYLSPEQASGNPLDAGSDLFSAGLVLSEMLTGNRVFRGKEEAPLLRQILEYEFTPIPGVCAPLNDFLSHLLARDRTHRFDSAKAAVCALRSIPLAVLPPEEAKKVVLATRETLARASAASTPPRRTRELSSGKHLPDPEMDIGDRDVSAGSGGLQERISSDVERSGHRSMRPGTAMFLGLAIAVAFIAVAVAVTGVNKTKVTTSLLQIEENPSSPAHTEAVVPSPPKEDAPQASPRPSNGEGIAEEDDRAELVRVLPPPVRKEPDPTGSLPPSKTVVIDRQNVAEAPAEPPSQEEGGSAKEAAGHVASHERAVTSPGFLSINVRPWAEVLVDGVSRGTTPLKKLRLKGGKHHVVLTNKPLGYRETIRTVVKPGEATTINRVVKRQE